MNTCTHRICRTTEPCRYGNPTLPDPTDPPQSADLLQSRGRAAARRQEQTRRRGELERAVEALPPRGTVLC